VIKLTHLSGDEFYANCDLIACIEKTPDTLIALTTGAKIMVAEVAEEVVERIVAYHRRILEGCAKSLTLITREEPPPAGPEEGE
jgi:flagellar protein FlbD